MARPIGAGAALAMKAGGHQVASRIDVIQGSTILASTDPTAANSIISVVDGTWSFDETRTIEGQMDVTLLLNAAAENLIPTAPTSVFSPVSKTELQAFLGFVNPTTLAPDVTSIGVFDFAVNDIIEEGGALKMELTGYDRSRGLDRYRFVNPYTIANGTNVVTAIQAIINLVYPTAVFVATSTAYTSPMLTFDTESSALDAVHQLAASIGFIVYPDYQGRWVIKPYSIAGNAQWTLQVGSDTLVLGEKRSLSDERSYNGVIARGESTGTDQAPVEAQAWDTDPTSPTYYDPANPAASSYGPVPFFMTSEYIVTTQQAQDAANGMLPKVKGMTESLQVDTRLNPAMELRDLIDCERARVGATGIYVAQAISGSFKAGRMQIQMRDRRL